MAVAFLVKCSGAAPPPSQTLGEQLRLLWQLGPRIALRMKAFNHAVEAMHQEDAASVGEHFMISLLGVLPHMQGKGLARLVLRSMLADADAAGLPVYLFTGNDRNEAMYARLGFVKHSQRSIGILPGEDGEPCEVIMRSMLRPAASHNEEGRV